jgi:hypothetical protein
MNIFLPYWKHYYCQLLITNYLLSDTKSMPELNWLSGTKMPRLWRITIALWPSKSSPCPSATSLQTHLQIKWNEFKMLVEPNCCNDRGAGGGTKFNFAFCSHLGRCCTDTGHGHDQACWNPQGVQGKVGQFWLQVPEGFNQFEDDPN